MKSFKAKCGSETIRTTFNEGYQRVALDVLVPNPWNPNSMQPEIYEKTKRGVAETLKEADKKLPPITCRPHPKYKRKLQIVDGFHRWQMLGELKAAEIDIFVIYVDTKQAMLLTAQLNYNRGEPDMEKYPQYLARMIKEHDDVDVAYLAARLPDSEDEIKGYLEAIDFEVDDIDVSDDDDEEDAADKDASDTDALLELKFVCRKGAAEVIEHELSRLGGALGGGKNVRGRALEVMAVLSSQTPTASIDATTNEEDESKAKRRKKKRLRVDL